jgi:phosphatidylinositol alpha-1,6-mannosyltransferase
VTNDLPPRAGGIQRFVGSLLERVHPGSTVVLGPSDPDAAAYDRQQPYRTVRHPGRVLPTHAVALQVTRLCAEHRPDVLVLGASWPLGELVRRLRPRVRTPVVALSHGLEAGLAQAGGGRLIRRATSDLAALTTITAWTEDRLAPHVRAGRTVRVPPGVDVDRFHPAVDGAGFRARVGVPLDAPVVGCISRLVPRKGQDTLLAAWPRIAAQHPDAWLLLVGSGPIEARLRRQHERLGPSGQRVAFTGAVGWDELPAAYASLDVFAMPCRTRLAGTDVEGLGIVYLEAQATGVPAIAGDSGGAPEAVLDGETGSVVDGRDVSAVAASVGAWLADPGRRAAAGAAGRSWTVSTWSWDAIAARFAGLLEEVAGRGEVSGRSGA